MQQHETKPDRKVKTDILKNIYKVLINVKVGKLHSLLLWMSVQRCNISTKPTVFRSESQSIFRNIYIYIYIETFLTTKINHFVNICDINMFLCRYCI